MLEQGPRGVELAAAEEVLTEEDLAGYGVDWEALDDAPIRTHHDEANNLQAGLEDEVADNPFIRQAPEHFSSVEVDEPNCPMTEEQIDFLNSELFQGGFLVSHSMASYRLCWSRALQICQQMFIL